MTSKTYQQPEKFTYHVLESTYGYAHTKKLVEKLSGEWPTHSDLISLVDNGSFTDKTPRHFGGVVSIDSNKAHIKIYTD